MHKKLTLLFICVICFLICVIRGYAEEETLTITTYYPSPYGNYREMRAQRIAIGNDYIQGSTLCWYDDIGCTGPDIDDSSGQPDIDLIVQGNVGIGTTGPAAKLEINGTIGSGQPNLFRITNTTANFLVVNGTTGNVGIGTTGPKAELEVAGQIKITGGSPAAGKVLTSDATGLATWSSSSGYNGCHTVNLSSNTPGCCNGKTPVVTFCFTDGIATLATTIGCAGECYSG